MNGANAVPEACTTSHISSASSSDCSSGELPAKRRSKAPCQCMGTAWSKNARKVSPIAIGYALSTCPSSSGWNVPAICPNTCEATSRGAELDPARKKIQPNAT